MIGPESHVEAQPCPSCGQVLDGASGVTGGANEPRPDALTMCVYCGVFLAYTGDMGLRLATMDESASAAFDVAEVAALVHESRGAQCDPHHG